MAVRLLGDQNLSQPAVERLIQAGHDIVTTRQLRLDRAADSRVLLESTELGRLVVTHDELDFVLLHDGWWRWGAAWGIERRHAGIIVLPQAQRWPPERTLVELESIVGSALDGPPAEAFAGRLWLWRRFREWSEIVVG